MRWSAVYAMKISCATVCVCTHVHVILFSLCVSCCQSAAFALRRLGLHCVSVFRWLRVMLVRFVGVTRPQYRNRGWVAQHRGSGVWKGGFQSAEQAARWLAKQLGTRPSSLATLARTKPRTKLPMLTPSRYRGVVVKRRSGGRILWEARVKGKVLRSFVSEEAAAAAVARSRRVSVASLARPTGFTRLHARRVFKASYPVFKKYLPGDLQHSREQEVQCQRQFRQELWTCAHPAPMSMFSCSHASDSTMIQRCIGFGVQCCRGRVAFWRFICSDRVVFCRACKPRLVVLLGHTLFSFQEPALRFLSIQLKYGPWRDVFLEEWVKALPKTASVSSSSGSGVPGVSTQARAKRIMVALVATCRRMQSVPDRVWVESLGRNISFASGPLATLSRLGVLKTCPADHTRRLQLGQTPKRLCSGVSETKRVEAMLLRWVCLADACEVQPPETCEQWVTEHKRVGQLFDEHCIFKANSYMRNYTIRALLMAAMSKGGISRLSGTGNVGTTEFARAFPDQGGWMAKLPRRGHNSSLLEFMQDIGYDGPAEMFSMFLCLLLTARMRLHGEWYAKHRCALSKIMVEQYTRNGVYRLPLLCVMDVLATCQN